MSASCCNSGCDAEVQAPHGRYRVILWLALLINAVMFGVEMLFGVWARSESLLADSLDFLGDAANYGISLWVLGMGLALRARATMLKAATMAVFGLWILGRTAWGLWAGNLPDAVTMGSIALLALVANVLVAAMLYAYREGDSNRRSVWICSRNDALGNIAVVLAAVGVFGTASGLPDLIVAGVMALLALSGAWQMWGYARRDLGRVSG
ncbi:MAG TPA: cation transporter [Thiolinea sp.]|nr:cation transporter [Thiolinea sp.]